MYVGGVANPSFLALHPNGRNLYCVNGGDASGGRSDGLGENAPIAMRRGMK